MLKFLINLNYNYERKDGKAKTEIHELYNSTVLNPVQFQ